MISQFITDVWREQDFHAWNILSSLCGRIHWNGTEDKWWLKFLRHTHVHVLSMSSADESEVLIYLSELLMRASARGACLCRLGKQGEIRGLQRWSLIRNTDWCVCWIPKNEKSVGVRLDNQQRFVRETICEINMCTWRGPSQCIFLRWFQTLCAFLKQTTSTTLTRHEMISAQIPGWRAKNSVHVHYHIDSWANHLYF